MYFKWLVAVVAILGALGANARDARAQVAQPVTSAGTEARLIALLADERKSLRRITPSRIKRIVSPFIDRTGALRRQVVLAPHIEYTRAFLASQPTAGGGRDWECLSEALYFEARGESVKGQFAVAEVILNRVDSPLFPDTVCKVVNQGTGRKFACQFTYTCDGYPEVIREHRAYRQVGKVARLMLDGAARSLTSGATYYHTASVHPKWARVFDRTVRIGYHLFYRRETRVARN
ncbi:MAG: cell wall hydrolase [Pseudomonadota bacterium]